MRLRGYVAVEQPQNEQWGGWMTYVVQLRGDNDVARYLPLAVLPVHDAHARRSGEQTTAIVVQGCLDDVVRARTPRSLRDVVSWSDTLGALARCGGADRAAVG